MKFSVIALLIFLLATSMYAQNSVWTPFSQGLPEPFEKIHALKTFDLCPPNVSGWGFEEMMVACTRGGVYGRHNAYDTPGDSLWQKLHNGTFYHAAVNEISKIIYLANAMELVKSSDRGKTWDVIFLASESDMLSGGLAVSPVDTAIIYFNRSHWTGTSGRVIKSSDGGKSWNPCDSTMTCNRVNCIAIHALRPDTVFVGTDRGLYRSFDGGKKFSLVFGNLEINSISMNPFNPEELILGTAGKSKSNGFYRSTNNGGTWDVFYYMVGNAIVQYNPYVKNQIFFSEADSSNIRTPPILVSYDGTDNLEHITRGSGFDCINCFCVSAIINHAVLGGTVSHGVMTLVTDATGIRTVDGSLPKIMPQRYYTEAFTVFDPLGRTIHQVPADRNSRLLKPHSYGVHIFKTPATGQIKVQLKR